MVTGFVLIDWFFKYFEVHPWARGTALEGSYARHQTTLGEQAVLYGRSTEHQGENMPEDEAGKDQNLKDFRPTIWADKPQKIVSSTVSRCTFSKDKRHWLYSGSDEQ